MRHHLPKAEMKIQKVINGLGLGILLAVFCNNNAFAVGTTGANFLKIEQSARVVGIGGAFVALADDADAIYWNPAGLGFLTNQWFSLTHHQSIFDLNQEFVSAVQGLGKAGSIGINVIYSSIGDVIEYDDFGLPAGEIQNFDFALDAAWGRKLGSNVALGLGIKFLASQIAEARASGLALDLGALYHLPSIAGLSAGFSVQNLGPEITYISNSDPLPLTLRIGVAYKRSLSTESLLKIGTEISKMPFPHELFYPQIGLEYSYKETYFVRTGFRFNRHRDKGSFGMGLRYSSFTFDYALRPFGILGVSHRFTLSLNITSARRSDVVEQKSHSDSSESRHSATPVSTEIPVPYDHAFSFSSDLFFSLGEATLRSIAFEGLRDALKVIQASYPTSFVLITGHTDNVKMSSASKFRSNYELSVERALSVRQYILAQGMNSANLDVLGYGDSKPTESNVYSKGRAANRRVELLIYSSKERLVEGLLQEATAFMSSEANLEALYVLLKVIDLDRNNAVAFRKVGSCYYKLGDVKQALVAFQRALKLNPGDSKLKQWFDQIRK